MTLVSDTIPNLINGVSQQPSALRNTSQCELQIDGLSTVVDGLVKRPPTEWVATLAQDLTGYKHHTYNRDAAERYLLSLDNNGLFAFDLTDGSSPAVDYGVRTETLQDAAVAVGNGNYQTVVMPATASTASIATSGTFVGTVVWESSVIGDFTDAATVATHTGVTSADVTFATGSAIRARVSAYTSGSITCTVGWKDTSYLQATDPTDNLRLLTVADFTFIANNEIVIEAGADVSETNGSEALVFVKIGGTGTYKVFIDGVEEATFTGTASSTTTDVAADLKADLVTSLGAGWTITLEHSTIHIVRDDGTAFTTKAEDPAAGTRVKVVTDRVQKFTDLPTIAPTGYIVEVIGDASSNFDNYYVKFSPNNEGEEFDFGVWLETVEPAAVQSINAATMPHQIVRQADGSFLYQQASWGLRVAGDDETAPMPSFVGKTINDSFFWRNRLGFLTDQNVVMSRAGEFFEFFPSTVTTILDTSPIDVANSHNKVSILYWAVPWKEELILFGEQTQFVFSTNGDILTPKTGDIDPSTEFSCSTLAKPVGAGTNLFFATESTRFAGVRELFVSGNNAAKDAAEITAHIPKYIKKNVFVMKASPEEDTLVLVSRDDKTTMYPYRFFWEGDQKLQSSWSKWQFNGAEILHADFIESYLYMLHREGSQTVLLRMDISDGAEDPNDAGYLTHLDRRVTEAQCLSVVFDSVTNRTTFTLPYAVNPLATYQIVTRTPASGSAPAGVILQGVEQAGSTVSVTGDRTGDSVFIGEKYTLRFQPSTPHLREDSANGGTAVITDGRLQMLHWSFVYANTGYFNIAVTHAHRDTPSNYQFTGRVTGASTNVLGQVALDSGTYGPIPIGAKNDEYTIEISNDSFLPSNLLSAGWVGDFTSNDVKRL